MKDQTDSIKIKYDRLNELIEKTAKNRFLASSRLEAHKHWSIWTVTLMTICVIGLALIQAMNIGESSSSQETTYAITLLSTFILVYSMTMSMSDFSLRAHHFHQCGLELMKLRGQVFDESMNNNEKQDKYALLNSEYGAILDKFENHSAIDYLRMQASAKNTREYYNIGFFKEAWIKLKYSFTFWHYVVLIFISLGYLLFASWHFFHIPVHTVPVP